MSAIPSRKKAGAIVSGLTVWFVLLSVIILYISGYDYKAAVTRLFNRIAGNTVEGDDLAQVITLCSWSSGAQLDDKINVLLHSTLLGWDEGNVFEKTDKIIQAVAQHNSDPEQAKRYSAFGYCLRGLITKDTVKHSRE